MSNTSVVAVHDLKKGQSFILNHLIYKVDKICEGRVYYKLVSSEGRTTRGKANLSLGAKSKQKVVLV